MSALIRSNVAYSGNLYPLTYQQISTTVQAVFDAYKARVQADGGTITDESATLNAINFLFDNKIYGKTVTFVSPKFGIKLDANGGVLKAYALDGDDLVGMNFGTGALPKIVDNHFKFNPSATTGESTNGAILTTTTRKVRTSKNRLMQAIKVRNIGSTAASSVVQLTNHLDYTMTATVAAIYAINISGGTIWHRHVTSPFSTSNGGLNTTGNLTNVSVGTSVVYGFDGLSNLTYSYRDGTGQTQQSYGWVLPDITQTEFYIDVGGMYKSSTNKLFTNIEVACVLILKDFVRDIAIAADAYVKNNH